MRFRSCGGRDGALARGDRLRGDGGGIAQPLVLAFQFGDQVAMRGLAFVEPRFRIRHALVGLRGQRLVLAIPRLAVGGMRVAYEAALILTPRVLVEAAVKRVSRAGAGFNHFTHAPLANAQSRAIVRPSPDLVYSACPFDLAKGPVLIHVASPPALYWSLSVFDANTNMVFIRNNRQAKGAPIRIALARADQTVPKGMETVVLNGDRGMALIRMLVTDRAAFPAIDAARRRSDCRPTA